MLTTTYILPCMHDAGNVLDCELFTPLAFRNNVLFVVCVSVSIAVLVHDHNIVKLFYNFVRTPLRGEVMVVLVPWEGLEVFAGSP